MLLLLVLDVNAQSKKEVITSLNMRIESLNSEIKKRDVKYALEIDTINRFKESTIAKIKKLEIDLQKAKSNFDSIQILKNKILENNQKLQNQLKISNDSLLLFTRKEPIDFLPIGYVIFERINGDINNDNIEDCILIIKGTDKSKIVSDEYSEQLDRNRRGIIILINKNSHYELALKNYNCFSSENEDGGVYYAPELSIEIEKGNLIVHYAHGRYGFWEYIFTFQNSDFELIGYNDGENSGPIVNSYANINFLSKKKLFAVNINENAVGGDEVFKETIENININRLIKLSEIKNFDELDLSIY
jgi:hypothetical protein